MDSISHLCTQNFTENFNPLSSKKLTEQLISNADKSSPNLKLALWWSPSCSNAIR